MRILLNCLTGNGSIVRLYEYQWNIPKVIWMISDDTSPHRNTTRCSDVAISAMVSQITGFSTVCSTVCSGANQRKHQSSASLAFVRVIHQWPVDSPHTKGQLRGNCFHKMTSSWKILSCMEHTADDFKRDIATPTIISQHDLFDTFI